MRQDVRDQVRQDVRGRGSGELIAAEEFTAVWSSSGEGDGSDQEHHPGVSGLW